MGHFYRLKIKGILITYLESIEKWINQADQDLKDCSLKTLSGGSDAHGQRYFTLNQSPTKLSFESQTADTKTHPKKDGLKGISVAAGWAGTPAGLSATKLSFESQTADTKKASVC